MGDDLYREICRCPGDDTLRLAYADWLDENGDPDRAEFVRCQVDWRRGRNEDRAYAILAAHIDWSRLPCGKCGGAGWRAVTSGAFEGGIGTCQVCSGTGDLFVAPGVSGASLTPPPKSRTVTFARGFPDSVSCTLAEAFGPDGTPTPWACEVVRRTPVTRFVLPYPVNYRGSSHYGAFGGEPAWDWSSANVPDFLMIAMAEAFPNNATGRDDTKVWGGGAVWWVEFGTEAEARDALALAAGRLVRRHVYGGAAA